MHKLIFHKQPGEEKTPLFPNENYVILSENGYKLGNFSFKLEGENFEIFYLSDFYIDVNFRGFGYGKSSLKKIIKFAKRLKTKEIRLIVDFDNEIAQKIYLNSGFSFTGKMEEYCYEMILNLEVQNAQE